MADKYCQGCGAQIQHTDQANFGFVPEHLAEQEFILCQRCFRISHYGRDELGAIAPSDSLELIRAGLAWSTGVVLVVDLLDFEAGLPAELLHLVKVKKLILALNKVDLIPEHTPFREVERWVQERTAHFGLSKANAVLISAVSGYGFPDLADMLAELGKKVLFVGITNVGKSSVIERLLHMRIGGGQRRKVKPTISAYPGTTVNVSRWHCPGGLVLADSPGYVPRGRISDLVEPEHAVKIIPHRSLSSHLFPIQPGDLVFIKGLCAVECLESNGEGLLLGFTGSGVQWQKSTSKHLNKWLEKDNEQAQIKGWERHAIELNPGQDLYISGLGWLSGRKAQFRLGLHIPQGAHFMVRPNLIGIKNRS